MRKGRGERAEEWVEEGERVEGREVREDIRTKRDCPRGLGALSGVCGSTRAAGDSGPAHHERGVGDAGCAEEAGWKPAPTQEQDGDGGGGGGWGLGG